MSMVDALNHEADSEEDILYLAFSNAGGLVSFKLLVLINYFKQNLLFCPSCHK